MISQSFPSSNWKLNKLVFGNYYAKTQRQNGTKNFRDIWFIVYIFLDGFELHLINLM